MHSLTVTYDGEDICGNPLYYSKTITVEGAPPAAFLELPKDTSLSCDEYEGFQPSYLAYSNTGTLKMAVVSCMITGEVLGELSGDYDACNGTMYQTWTFTDQCERTITHVQKIQLYDDEPPVMADCPEDITICDNETMPEIIPPSATDNCDTEVPVTWVRSDGATNLNDKFEPGETTITFTAVDDCENTASCSMKVTVYRAPAITVVDLTECSTDEGGTTAVFALEDAITSIYFPSGQAVYVSSLHGTIPSTQEALDNYTGADGERITITLTTLDLCVTSATFTLNVVKRPVLTVHNLTECSTEEGGTTAVFDILSNVSAVGGNLAFVSNINGPLSLADMDAYSGTNGEIITVSSTTPPPAFCQTIKTITIKVNPRPILQNASATYCEDGYSDFNVTTFNNDVLVAGQNFEDFDFEWPDGSLNLPDLDNPSRQTDFTVKVTNRATGCFSEATLTVTVNLCSWLNLTKTTNKSVDPTLNWTFVLYKGTYGNLTEIASETTMGVTDGVLFREAGPLSRYNTYTVCELGVPAGYGTTWMIDPDGDGLFDIIPYTTFPGTNGIYNPNSLDSPPQDLGNRCYEIQGSLLPANQYGNEPPLALQLQVDNTFPGGDARTPGYWKNWNTCTGGGQQYTATANSVDKNGDGVITAFDRVYSGWALLDDIIELFGITWGEFELTTCEDARKILDNRDLNGVNRASDPAYTLAKHLLAYQLNQGAGAYICYEMAAYETEAVNLLIAINFQGIGDYLKKINSPTLKKLASRALELAAIFDAYNNNKGCPDEAGGGDTDPVIVTLSCTTTVTNITKKVPVGKVVVNAVGGTSPYMYSMNGGIPQASNEFSISVAGTYTFTVTDSSTPMQTCTCTAKVTSTVKSAEIATGIVPDVEYASLKVYPNPFSSELRFEFESPETANARIDLYDMTGRKVKTIFEQPVEGGVLYNAEFKPDAVVSGMYFYRITLGEAVFNGKVLYKK